MWPRIMGQWWSSGAVMAPSMTARRSTAEKSLAESASGIPYSSAQSFAV
jgi:hypothetical protein